MCEPKAELIIIENQKYILVNGRNEIENEVYTELQKKYGKTDSFLFMKKHHLEGTLFEYIDINNCITLDDVIDDEHKIFPKMMKRIMIDLFIGLKKLHSVGYCHGDIGEWKNLVLEHDNLKKRHPKLKRAILTNFTSSRKIREQTDINNDIWTLATVFLHLIDGENASQWNEATHVAGNVPQNYIEYSKYVKSLIEDVDEYDEILHVIYDIISNYDKVLSIDEILLKLELRLI